MADFDGSAPAPPERFQLFEAGRRRAYYPLNDLWVQYVSRGGSADLFSLDAFMHGVMPLPPGQQDILANAINERLDDLCEAAKVPYLYNVEVDYPGVDPLVVLDDLFGPLNRDTTARRTAEEER